MKPVLRHFFAAVLLSLIVASCSKEEGMPSDASRSASGNKEGSKQSAGVLTAGEWNDLENWGFWLDLMQQTAHGEHPYHWSFYNRRRIAVEVRDPHQNPLANVEVTLKRAGSTLFTARTNYKGVAELWADLFRVAGLGSQADLQIELQQGARVLDSVIPYHQGVNTVILPALAAPERAELAFVVDATGSMSDEIRYLQAELLNVITRVRNANMQTDIRTGAVFYRDEQDEYLTRHSDFSSDVHTTLNFIRAQQADGGGDWPEAVHTALEVAIQQLQWSTDCKARILFLVLDAPPHRRADVISSLQAQTLLAAEKGIQIIPITASGIDKSTEFLMRFLALSTNGTYVFLTDDSGVGDPHLTPSVGPYQVEFLNDLLVRLINEQLQ